MEKEIVIERPIRTVFDYVADTRNSKDFLGPTFTLEALTPPPFGVGTKALGTSQFLHIPIRLHYTLEEYREDEIIRLVCPHELLNGVPVESSAVWRFEERGPGRTWVSFNLVIQPHHQAQHSLAYQMSRPIIYSAELMVSRLLDGALGKLKHILESKEVTA